MVPVGGFPPHSSTGITLGSGSFSTDSDEEQEIEKSPTESESASRITIDFIAEQIFGID
jgi:hypothetical protein